LHANGAPQSDDITCVALHFHFAKNSVADNKPQEDQQAS
jgi:hypothetical protein